MKTLVHFDADAHLTGQLTAQASHEWDITVCPERDDERFYRLLPEAEVLWHVLRPLDASDMARAPRLRLIQKLGTGVNSIDVAAAAQRGIAVANMPGTNAQAVAEAALMLMLSTLRRGLDLHERTRAGKAWPIDPGNAGHELGGRTVGLLGHGEVARRLHRMLEAIGAEVLHTSRHERSDPGWRMVDELLPASDVVSVHLPLTEDTRHLLDERRLALLPTGAVVVNTARGAVIDEAALIHALRSGDLAGAGLDVFETEPLAVDNPLLRLDNVVVSPHVAWLTHETLRRCVDVAIENTHRLQHQKELLHRVA